MVGQLVFTETGLVDLPEIDQLLIVGASDTSFNFSEDIQDLGLFSKVYHVESITQGVRLIKSMRFSVVLIDHDDDEQDTISTSRIINVNDPLSRIILISAKVEISEALKLKNKGIIHGYIPLKQQKLVAHSIIVNQQSNYEINKSLMRLVKSPPKFSSLYSKLIQKQASKLFTFKFVGMAVLESTVFKYSYFMKEENIDLLLTSSYLSALSIYGKNLFEDQDVYPLSYIEFGEFTIFIKTINIHQYLFFIKKRKETKVKIIEDAINKILNRFQIKFQDYFSRYSDNQGEIDFQEELSKIMRLNNEQNLILDYGQNSIIANYDMPDPKMMSIFESTENVYEVHDFLDERHLYDFLKEEICHILLINNVSSNFSTYKSVIETAKRFSPYTQIIVVLSDLDHQRTFNLLNQESIDKYISTDFSEELYYGILKESVERSKKIRKLSNLQDLYQFYFSSAQTEVIKTLLLQDPKTLNKMTQAQFHGIIILRESKRIYSEFLVEENYLKEDKEEILISFMLSLMDFSSEYSSSKQTISSVKFGHSNIIVENFFGFSFIFFIGDLDQSNIDYVQEYLSIYAKELFDTIINWDNIILNLDSESLEESSQELTNIVYNKCINLVADLTIL